MKIRRDYKIAGLISLILVAMIIPPIIHYHYKNRPLIIIEQRESKRGEASLI